MTAPSDPTGSVAPGWPGIAPTWTSSAKDAIGTAQAASRVWFTVGRGILNEVYWPRVDHPQIRDLGFIVADGHGFWSEVKREASHEIAYVAPGIPAIEATHRHAAYELHLRICTSSHADVVRIEARLTDLRPPAASDADADAAGVEAGRAPLRLYPLLAPHLEFSGLHNHAWTDTYKGRPIVLAQHRASCLALASSPAAARQSVGFVGTSDGWQDFAANGRMTWEYAATADGNVAAMTEVEPGPDGIVELALGFGTRPEEAALLVSAELATEFESAWAEYVEGWRAFQSTCADSTAHLPPELRETFMVSSAVLQCHEDRTAPGAIVASLSIPWGSAHNDRGGYHLVWSRDLVESAGALVALGASGEARRTIAYLVATQEADGHWLQNQWVDGVGYWSGVQLDEAAYPILLAASVRREGARHMHGRDGDLAEVFAHLVPDDRMHALVKAAAGFIVRTGPATLQDRWEENAGLTPSTLAPVVAALVAAGRLFDHDSPEARYCLELADDWNASIEDWTYAAGSELAARYGVPGHYVRIADPAVLSGAPLATPIQVRNQPPGTPPVPATELVGTDFLSLVRFGLRTADDPRIRATLAVVDGELRIETPAGPTWRRYNHDGYGETADGGPFDGAGIGRGWPLLTGERGHYALDAGEDALPYLAAMRAMGSAGGMLPEQVWDTTDIPSRELFLGRPSGSAMPLAWAHAEYIKLARSIALGHPIDRPAEAWERYHGQAPRRVRSTWRLAARRPAMPAGTTLRIETLAPAIVHWSADGWRSVEDAQARSTGLGVWTTDLPGSAELPPGASIVFTIYWPPEGAGAPVAVGDPSGRWEGSDFAVAVGAREP